MRNNPTVIHNTEIVHLRLPASQLTRQLPISHDKVSLEGLADFDCHVERDWYEILEHLEVPYKVLGRFNIAQGSDVYKWILLV